MSAGALAVLAGLPGIGPRRLRRILSHHDPDDALGRLAGGGVLAPMVVRAIPANVLAAARSAAASASVSAAAERCERADVQVLGWRDPAFPAQLAVDPEPPAVLFVRGDLDVLTARRVGVIGTRNATSSGLATAAELGAALADEGVAVVSGLARGIDGASHRGVRGSAGPGRPVGVVGNGLDRPYPRQHADLWGWVGETGLLVSEWPPGVGPDAFRFPLRNRILAALCEVLVVVESRERGGSLITARAAADRGVDVMAVPGSPRVRASMGTNQLLRDGVAPVTAAADVLDVLGIEHRHHGAHPVDPRPVPTSEQQRVLGACADAPCTLDMLVSTLGIGVAEAAMAAARLERDGWLVEAGGWFEPAGSRLVGR